VQVLFVLPANIREGSKYLAMTKTVAYFAEVSMTKKKAL
jgi:hypothetical protein